MMFILILNSTYYLFLQVTKARLFCYTQYFLGHSYIFHLYTCMLVIYCNYYYVTRLLAHAVASRLHASPSAVSATSRTAAVRSVDISAPATAIIELVQY